MKLLKKKELREAKKAATKEKVKNDFKAKFFEDLEEDEKKLNQRARKSGKTLHDKANQRLLRDQERPAGFPPQEVAEETSVSLFQRDHAYRQQELLKIVHAVRGFRFLAG